MEQREISFVKSAHMDCGHLSCACVQTLVEELIYFALRYIPSLLVCLGCHAANLFSFCVLSTSSVANTSLQIAVDDDDTVLQCHLAFGAV